MYSLHCGYRMFEVQHEKSLVPVFLKISIAHPFVSLESGKTKYCFAESLEKVLTFGSKNLCEP